MSGRRACCIHAYTVYTPIGGKGRCSTRCDPQVHRMQAIKCVDDRTNLALKPIERVTRSKTGAISGPTKWTLVQQNIKFKKCKTTIKAVEANISSKNEYKNSRWLQHIGLLIKSKLQDFDSFKLPNMLALILFNLETWSTLLFSTESFVSFCTDNESIVTTLQYHTVQLN